MLSPRDPLTKLAVALAAILMATVSQAALTSALLLALALVLLIAERVPPGRLARAMGPFLLFAASVSWIQLVAPAGSPQSGREAALLVFTRTLAVGAVSMAFALTTDPAALGRALVHRAGLPRRVVFGALAAIQLLPRLADDLATARLTARAALAPGRAGPLRRWFAGLSPGLLVVLLAAAVRRAGAAALAMELRGVGAAGAPSAWRVPVFERADLGFALCAVSVMGLCYFASWV